MAKPMAGIYNEARTSDKKAKKKLRSMNIEAADNGGYTVRHDFEQNAGSYVEPETHVFSSGPEMVGHVMKMHNVKAADLKGEKAEPGGKSGMEEGEERDEGDKKTRDRKRSESEEKGED